MSGVREECACRWRIARCTQYLSLHVANNIGYIFVSVCMGVVVSTFAVDGLLC